MAETNARDDLLNDLKKIFLGSFSDFTGCQRRRRMGDKQYAETFLNAGRRNGVSDPIGQIHGFFRTGRGYLHQMTHGKTRSARGATGPGLANSTKNAGMMEEDGAEEEARQSSVKTEEDQAFRYGA